MLESLEVSERLNNFDILAAGGRTELRVLFIGPGGDDVRKGLRWGVSIEDGPPDISAWPEFEKRKNPQLSIFPVSFKTPG